MHSRTFRATILAGIALGLSVSPFMASASPKGGEEKAGGCPMRGESGKGPHHLLEMEGLSESQRDQLKAVMEEHRPAMKEARQAFREGKREVHQAMRAGKGPQKVQAVAEQQGERLVAMIQAKARIKREVRKVLGEEQWQQLHSGEGQGPGRHMGHGSGAHGQGG